MAKTLAPHPAAELFPLMDGERLGQLRADIEAHGLRQPIVLCDGKILDGRNRYRACMELGIEPVSVTFEGDPYAYAWSANGARRDLVAAQRYLIWAEVAEKSEAWQAEQAAIAERANRARSKKTKAQPRTGGGEFATGGATTSGSTRSDKAAKTSTAKAKASKTNRGEVERMDRLRKERPDLAVSVRAGEMKAAEAMRQMKKGQVAQKVQALPAGTYRVIYADPPWSYGNTQPDYHTEQRDHYPVMTLSEICALPVREMAQDDAVLFLWVTSPILEESFDVIRAWGFKYKSSFVWDKVKHNMGHYNSVRHEFLLVCVRGSCQPDVLKLVDSVQTIERTKHSRKPLEFYDIIEMLYPHGARVELFARYARKGWEAWGFEAINAA